MMFRTIFCSFVLAGFVWESQAVGDSSNRIFDPAPMTAPAHAQAAPRRSYDRPAPIARTPISNLQGSEGSRGPAPAGPGGGPEDAIPTGDQPTFANDPFVPNL